MFERFTARARRVMALANEEARRLNHEYIGTEHMLLGLVKEGGGVGAAVLKQHDVDLDNVLLEVEKLVKSGPDEVAGGKLPATPRAKKVIEYAIEEARNIGHKYVGTEHLLLGLIRERDGVAAQALVHFGLDLDQVRVHVMDLLGAGDTGSLEDHVSFWQAMSDGFTQGVRLFDTLRQARRKLKGTPLEGIVRTLMKRVREGKPLSEAMAAEESTFSRSVQQMMHAGEAGGVLAVAAERILEGTQDGSFRAPGCPPLQTPPAVRFWRAFGRLLATGVPILEVLTMLGEEYSGSQPSRGVASIRQGIMDGRSMADTMRELPDLFDENICAAVDAGERLGNLAEQAMRIADALAADDLSLLTTHEAIDSATADQGPPAVRAFNGIILEVGRNRASDVHFDPHRDGSARVRHGIDGVLHDRDRIPAAVYPGLVNRIKMLAMMDVAQHRIPQDGRIKLTVDGDDYDLRACVTPVLHGERIVIRMLSYKDVKLDLARILADADLETVRRLCRLPHGMVVCTGPTGSGKTTLLYSMLTEMDRDTHCIMSIEDPVEYAIEGVGQIGVHTEVGLSFGRAFRAVLRQDPDVILVGEIRNLEVLQICVQASLTGHLVLTTLHADTAPGAIRRMLDIGLEPFLINSSQSAVIAQRLMRLLCCECKQPTQPTVDLLPPEAVEFVREHTGTTFYSAKGCDACLGTGYRGRAAMHEILIPEERFRRAVAASADVTTLRDAAIAAGMQPMIINGLEKAAAGDTSIDEVCRIAPHGPNV